MTGFFFPEERLPVGPTLSPEEAGRCVGWNTENSGFLFTLSQSPRCFLNSEQPSRYQNDQVGA